MIILNSFFSILINLSRKDPTKRRIIEMLFTTNPRGSDIKIKITKTSSIE
jgi:hypothetical protein